MALSSAEPAPSADSSSLSNLSGSKPTASSGLTPADVVHGFTGGLTVSGASGTGGGLTPGGKPPGVGVGAGVRVDVDSGSVVGALGLNASMPLALISANCSSSLIMVSSSADALSRLALADSPVFSSCC